MGHGIQAVSFDVGGTLIEPWPSVGHIYAETAKQFDGAMLDPELLNRRFHVSWKAMSRPLHSASDWAELVDQVFLDLVQPPPSRSFFSRLYDRFAEAGAWLLHPDVVPTLEGLSHEGTRLAVVSNWDHRLRPLLDQLGLSHFFNAVMVSCEVGAAKPDPAIFECVASALDLSPGSILHVGDDPLLDLAAAQSAGLRALLIQRGKPAKTFPHIESLREVIDFVHSHGRRDG